MIRVKTILQSLLLAFLLAACIAFPHPQEAVLKEVFERADKVALEAELTGNTSHLADVFTKTRVETIKQSIQEKGAKKANALYDETEVDWVKVVSYNPPEATIEVKYFYRTFSYMQETGERKYYYEPHRYWQIWKVKMRQEDGIWKVDESLEFIDWSG